jgi:shikimate kinase
MLTPPQKILLAGFSGCGKSTVLRQFSQLFPHIKTVELDQLSQGNYASIEDLVEDKGWDYFRQRELQLLQAQLEQPDPMVMALGGGTLERAWPVIERHPEVQVVYLEQEFEVCWERIKLDQVSRPLVALGHDSLRALYQTRVPLYQRSHFCLPARGNPRDLALAISRLVGLA